MSTQVYFIGAGPGDPELITVKGRRLIESADLVLYAGSLVPVEVVACAKPGARVEDSAPLALERTHALIMETVHSGGLVARVHTGDPSLYGAVREQMRLLDAEHVAYEVVPGVTAAFAAAAAAKVSLTVPGASQSVILTRTEGRTPMPESERLRHLAGHHCAVAVYLSGGDPEQVEQELLAAGLGPDTAVVIGHRIGQEGELILRSTVAELAHEVRNRGLDRRTVFLVLPGEAGQEARSRLYDEHFSHGHRP